MAGADGGDKGPGTINATALYAGAQTLRLSDDGSARGPSLTLDRASASPAASDALGQIIFDGRDSAGNSTTYALINGFISDPTNGSEDGGITFATTVAGSNASRAFIGAGLVVGAPTGGDKGVGTINASAIYDDNTQISDYVFDVHLDGAAKPMDGERAVRFDARYLDPDEFAAFWREHRHMPAMPSRAEWEANGKSSLGDLVQRLWETVEVQAVHIEVLNARLKALEARL